MHRTHHRPGVALRGGGPGPPPRHPRRHRACRRRRADGVPVDAGLPKALDVMHHLVDGGTRSRRDSRPRPGLPIDLGRDGRLTMLLMGSDWRKEGGGERTDMMMVATIDPTTGVAAVVSIPRDMENIPLDKGGTSGATRVNSIYYINYRDSSLGHGQVDRAALTHLTRDIAAVPRNRDRLLGVPALRRLRGRSSTSSAGSGIDIDEAVLDSSYRHGSSHGVWFPEEKGYRLRGDPKCKPKPRKCRSALVYARSRKGTMGSRPNDDYRRSERQQMIVLQGVKRALERHGPGITLLGLLHGVRGHLETNVPMTPEAAAQLFGDPQGRAPPTQQHEGARTLRRGPRPRPASPSDPISEPSATGWTGRSIGCATAHATDQHAAVPSSGRVCHPRRMTVSIDRATSEPAAASAPVTSAPALSAPPEIEDELDETPQWAADAPIVDRLKLARRVLVVSLASLALAVIVARGRGRHRALRPAAHRDRGRARDRALCPRYGDERAGAEPQRARGEHPTARPGPVAVAVPRFGRRGRHRRPAQRATDADHVVVARVSQPDQVVEVTLAAAHADAPPSRTYLRPEAQRIARPGRDIGTNGDRAVARRRRRDRGGGGCRAGGRRGDRPARPLGVRASRRRSPSRSWRTIASSARCSSRGGGATHGARQIVGCSTGLPRRSRPRSPAPTRSRPPSAARRSTS